MSTATKTQLFEREFTRKTECRLIHRVLGKIGGIQVSDVSSRCIVVEVNNHSSSPRVFAVFSELMLDESETFPFTYSVVTANGFWFITLP